MRRASTSNLEVGTVYVIPSGSEARIERLEPDVKTGRFRMPATVYKPESGGECLWEGRPEGIVYRTS